MAIGKAEKAAYAEEVKGIKGIIDNYQKQVKDATLKKKQGGNLKAYYCLELVIYYIKVIELYLKMSDISMDMLGIKNEAKANNTSYDSFAKAIDLLLQMRLQAKQNKDWATSDKIRNELTDLGFEIKDTKEGFEWRLNR